MWTFHIVNVEAEYTPTVKSQQSKTLVKQIYFTELKHYTVYWVI